jgi:hypothetical protein
MHGTTMIGFRFTFGFYVLGIGHYYEGMKGCVVGKLINSMFTSLKSLGIKTFQLSFRVESLV